MRTVLHCSAGAPDAQRHALANAANLLADETVALSAVAVVFNGDGVEAVRADSSVADDVRGLLARTPEETNAADAPSIEVCACGNSLAGRDIPADELVYGVDVVSSGVGELTRRQADGYAYVKAP
ncbi:DsrE family protein [Halobaculum lipolyticum]|uniref:DsrE family protein n=1 Tax=Halobaculum lipolyticum TaxID=3032001 RepID=A0ABD5WGU3_9EURY|nr:DsrE family protein [Halobaculum sp. DT31]